MENNDEGQNSGGVRERHRSPQEGALKRMKRMITSYTIGPTAKQYLECSMFDGFAELAEINNIVLRTFWTLLIIFLSIVCVSQIMAHVIRYGTQPILNRVSIQPLEDYPFVIICLNPQWRNGVEQGNFLAHVQKVEEANTCALGGSCSKNNSANATGPKTWWEDTTSKNFKSRYYDAINLHPFGDHEFNVRVEGVVSNPYDERPGDEAILHSKVEDFFDSTTDLRICRKYTSTSTPYPGFMQFKAVIHTLDKFSQEPTIDILVSLGFSHDAPQPFNYTTKIGGNVYGSFVLKGAQRLTDCIDNVFELDQKTLLCDGEYAHRHLSCCLCGGFLEYCPADAKCCLPGDIPEDFLVKVKDACKRQPAREPCSRIDISQSSVHFVDPEEPGSNTTHIELNFDDVYDVIVIQEYYAISFDDLIAALGGVISLFIGGSIVGFVHVFYFFFGRGVLLKYKDKLCVCRDGHSRCGGCGGGGNHDEGDKDLQSGGDHS